MLIKKKEILIRVSIYNTTLFSLFPFFNPNKCSILQNNNRKSQIKFYNDPIENISNNCEVTEENITPFIT